MRARWQGWLGGALGAGIAFTSACGWVGGGQPTSTPIVPLASPSPSPSPASTPVQIAPAAPPPLPSPSPSPSPVAAAGETYTVSEGDTLGSIAERFYGDPTLWRRIYDANRSAIGDNPDNVRVGTVLTIPPRPQ